MKSKTMIYIVRHGETDWNIGERMQGQTNVPLNSAGVTQAKKIARDLKSIQLNHIYTSPLSRALQTAKIINEFHNAPMTKEKVLMERHFGVLEGKSYKEVNKYHTAMTFGNSWLFPDFKPPEGESLNDIRIRVSTFIKKIIKKHPTKSILIVSHGVTLRILISILMDIPLELLDSLWMGNAGLTIVEQSSDHGASLHVANYQAS